MRTNVWLVGVGLFVLMLAGSAASGDIINGDFENGANGWHLNAYGDTDNGGDATCDVIAVGGGHLLELYAKTRYAWDAGASRWRLDGTDPYNSYSWARPDEAPYAPDGKLYLEFWASAVYAGCTPATQHYDDAPKVTVMVYHMDSGSLVLNTLLITGAWSRHQVYLEDMDNNFPVAIYLDVETELSEADCTTPPTGGETERFVEVTGRFDDFQFVPEPATMLLLGMGGLGVFLRRRKA